MKLLACGMVLASMIAVAGGGVAPQPIASAWASSTQDPSSGRGLRSLDGAEQWLNSPPLTAESLRGKVVLIDFWTYSCINWRREYPYVRAWFDKYRSQGLVVVGVHSPEFDFEKEAGNVRRAVKDIGVGYPVVIDSGHRIWRAFGNAYWPALYFIDAQGKIRAHQFGEGDYARSERIIQQLLSEAGSPAASTDLVAVNAGGPEAAADWKNLKSPENYVGYARTQYFASPGGVVPDRRQLYSSPSRLASNRWALSGDWTIGPESATSQAAKGRIVYRFQARDLHLVMGPGPAARGTPVRFRVRIDGKPPGASRGVDVDEQGYGTLDYPRMYQLIRQAGPVADRLFEIEFLDPGAEAFSFSFG